MSTTFDPSSFDAVVALYSIFHIPREAQPALFQRIHRWLRPGGYLLCTLSHQSEAGYTEDDFHGVTMYWSNYGLGEYLGTLAGAGFVVLETSSTACGCDETDEVTIEDHPLVLAQRGHLQDSSSFPRSLRHSREGGNPPFFEPGVEQDASGHPQARLDSAKVSNGRDADDAFSLADEDHRRASRTLTRRTSQRVEAVPAG